MDRRTLLAAAGVGVLAGVSGCLDSLREVRESSDDAGRSADGSDDHGNESDDGGSEPNGDGEGVAFEVGDLDPEETTIAESEPLDVGVTVTNVGDGDGTHPLELRIGGDEFATERVELAPGETETVTFEGVETDGLEPGEYTMGIGLFPEGDRITGTITVEAKRAVFDVSGIDPEDATIGEGASIDLGATIENTGDASGTQGIELRVADGLERSETVTLEPGETERVAFDGLEPGPGVYSPSIASEDDEATGRLVVSDLAVRIEEHEAAATPVEFEALALSGPPDESVFGARSEGSELHPTDVETFSEADEIPPLTGEILESEDETDGIDREALDTYFDPVENGDTEPSEFVDETDFDAQSLLLVRFIGEGGAAVVTVDFVGELAEDGSKTYLRVERETGSLTTLSQAATFVRIDEPDPPEILVGDWFGTSHALHTNDTSDT